MITSLPRGLDRLLAAIRQHAPAAKVVVTGYPLLFDLARPGSCAGMSHREQTELNRGANLLDDTIKSAAATARRRVRRRPGRVPAATRSATARPGCTASTCFGLNDSFHPTIAGQTRGYLPAFTAAAR